MLLHTLHEHLIPVPVKFLLIRRNAQFETSVQQFYKDRNIWIGYAIFFHKVSSSNSMHLSISWIYLSTDSFSSAIAPVGVSLLVTSLAKLLDLLKSFSKEVYFFLISFDSSVSFALAARSSAFSRWSSEIDQFNFSL